MITKRTRTIKKQFWLNEEESTELARKSSLADMNESEYIRNLILGYTPKEKPDDRFYEVMKTMRNTANNLNQLARKANSLGFIDEVAYRKQVDKLDSFIDEVKDEFLLCNKKEEK